MNSIDSLNALKKHCFLEFLNLVGKVYILVQYSDNVILGNRKFTEEEKNKGIVLVFNTKMNFSLDDSGINATLVFNTSAQKCFIPIDDIVAVYSPELNAQFIAAPVKSFDKSKEMTKDNKKIGKVVEVDFTKKRNL